ncbi:unnamed protein product [Cunninghamella echinulata]
MNYSHRTSKAYSGLAAKRRKRELPQALTSETSTTPTLSTGFSTPSTSSEPSITPILSTGFSTPSTPSEPSTTPILSTGFSTPTSSDSPATPISSNIVTSKVPLVSRNPDLNKRGFMVDELGNVFDKRGRQLDKGDCGRPRIRIKVDGKGVPILIYQIMEDTFLNNYDDGIDTYITKFIDGDYNNCQLNNLLKVPAIKLNSRRITPNIRLIDGLLIGIDGCVYHNGKQILVTKEDRMRPTVLLTYYPNLNTNQKVKSKQIKIPVDELMVDSFLDGVEYKDNWIIHLDENMKNNKLDNLDLMTHEQLVVYMEQKLTMEYEHLGERFERIKNFEIKGEKIDLGDYYLVSTLGRIFSLKSMNFQGLYLNKNGYYVVSLQPLPNTTYNLNSTPVHKLVAYTYLGPRPSKEHDVDHINQLKLDNRLENLRYLRHNENAFRKRPEAIKVQNNSDYNWGTPFEAHEMDSDENNWCNIDEAIGDNFSNYEISRSGNIRKTHSKEYIRYYTLLEYKVVSLYGTDKLEYIHSVHRLVAKCFVINSNESVFNIVDHIDRQRSNNVYTNLRWVTQKMNVMAAIGKKIKIEDIDDGENEVYDCVADAKKSLKAFSFYHLPSAKKSTIINNVQWKGIKRNIKVTRL